MQLAVVKQHICKCILSQNVVLLMDCKLFLEHSVCKSCRGPRLFGFLCWVFPQSVHFASPAVKQHIRERILPPKCGSSWQNVNIFRALSPYQWAHTVCVCVGVCVYLFQREDIIRLIKEICGNVPFDHCTVYPAQSVFIAAAHMLPESRGHQPFSNWELLRGYWVTTRATSLLRSPEINVLS